MRAMGRVPAPCLCRCLLTAALMLSGRFAQASVTCTVSPLPFPLWFSGTNRSAGGTAVTSPKTAPLTLVILTVNGIEVRRVTPSPVQGQLPQVLGAVFDSTNFQDGAPVTVRIWARNSLGEEGSAEATAPACNKAYVYGNVLPDLGGIGTLLRGYDVANTLAPRLQSARHTVTPATPTGAVNQRHDAIRAAIPPNTVFALYSHGDPGMLGDSATTNPGSGWVTAAQVASQVGAKTAQQPPCNFVFVDACSAGANDSLSVAFGTSTYGPYIQDRAFVGWPRAMQDNDSLRDWTDRLFVALLTGKTVRDAVADADGGGKPLDWSGDPTDAAVFGDPDYKLRGVYLGAGLAFSR